MKFLIVDEISMASSNLWADIDSRWGKITIMTLEKAFIGLPIKTVADLLELSPIRGKLLNFLRRIL